MFARSGKRIGAFALHSYRHPTRSDSTSCALETGHDKAIYGIQFVFVPWLFKPKLAGLQPSQPCSHSNRDSDEPKRAEAGLVLRKNNIHYTLTESFISVNISEVLSRKHLNRNGVLLGPITAAIVRD